MSSARALPNGVVTFLMTDVEGSTRLWERDPEAMRQALVRHDTVLAACIERYNGHVVKSRGEGDSIFAVFRHVRDAVSAALISQCALAVERWTTATPLRVRMAIHTGQIELRDGDYYGPTVNRCARLRAMATGGQVLLSGVAARLTQRQLPGGASLMDLGTHSLKDLAALEHVWQLTHPKMPAVGEAANGETQTPTARPPNHRAYKLTDHLNRSADGREWYAGASYAVSGFGGPDNDSHIRLYASPALAALLNGQNERFRLPRLWETTVDVDVEPGEAIVACREVTAVRQMALPTLTAKHHAQFAVHCARAAYDGAHQAEFGAWAECWLAGQDGSGMNARSLADVLESDDQDGAPALPGDRMAANAARAAMHAARVSFLAGRAREEESARAIELATEAVHTALRMAQLDLPALAEQVVPKVIGPVLPIRPISSPIPNRILRALPT